MAERPTSRSAAGFAGLRLPLVVSGFASLSSLVVLIIGSIWGAFADADTRALKEEISDHRVAGEQAVAALNDARAEIEKNRAALWEERKIASEGRASELALFATLRADETRRKTGIAALALPSSWKPKKNERVGIIEPATDRIIDFVGLDIARGSTLSSTLPALAALLKEVPADRAAPHEVLDADGVWSIGPPLGDWMAVARVEFEPLVVSRDDPIERAHQLVGGIAAPEGANGPLLLLLLPALAGAIAAGAWARHRVTAPIARSIDASRDFVHGRQDARADPDRGGRDAREVAQAVNALIDRAERAIERGRAERGDDLSNAVLAIERLGKGDLREGIVPPGPLAQAIDRARGNLLERVSEIHHAALEVASQVSEIAPLSRLVTDSAAEQLASLRRLTSTSDQGLEEIRRKAAELVMSIDSLTATAQDHREAIQELRTSLSGLSRRVMALRGTAEEAHALAARAETIDQALSMLSRLAGQSDAQGTKARATALVGGARAAMSEIANRLHTLEQEMLRAAHGLEIVTQSQPEAPTMIEASVTQPFQDASAILVRTLELTVACLSALERAAHNTASSGDAMYIAARHAIDLVPRLGAALSAIRLGTSFEEQVLERLGRMQVEVDAVKRTDGLTADGKRMMAELIEASETARSRLMRLAQTTEAAIRAITG